MQINWSLTKWFSVRFLFSFGCICFFLKKFYLLIIFLDEISKAQSASRWARVFSSANFFLFFKNFEYFRRFSRGGWLASLRTIGPRQRQFTRKAWATTATARRCSPPRALSAGSLAPRCESTLKAPIPPNPDLFRLLKGEFQIEK